MARIKPARPSGVWSGEMVPGANDWGRLDANQALTVSGDAGGSYAPTAPIVIGGSGGLISSAALASGGVTTATGGRIEIASSAGDFPGLTPSRERTVSFSLIDTLCTTFDSTTVLTQVGGNDSTGYGVTAISPTTGLYYLAVEVPGRYAHAGARLASFELEFVVTRLPSALPANPMQIIWSGADNTGAFATTAWPGLGTLTPWVTGATIALTSSSNIFWNPSGPTTNVGYYFACTNAGSGHIGSTEPTWPVVVGATTAPDSNGVVWTCTGRNGQYAFAGANPQSYYAKGAAQTLAFDTFGTSDPSAPTVITNVLSSSQRYSILFNYADPTVLFTGITLVYDSIATMAFA